MLHKIRLLLLLFMAGLVSMIILYFVSEWKKNQKSGFNRRIKTGVLSLKHELDLQHNSYYIAGASESQVYLGNNVANSVLRVVSNSFTETRNLDLLVKKEDSIAWGGILFQVDSPNVYASERVTPSLIYARLGDMNGRVKKEIGQKIYQVKHLSPSSMVAVLFDTVLRKNVLVIMNSDGIKLRPETPILSAEGDGVFSVDGILMHAPGSEYVIYVYYYRNEFVVMDTALRKRYIAHTIDTIAHNNLRIAKIPSIRMSTLIDMPVIVNKRACFDDATLFIHSTRKADNERYSKKRSVVDCYDLSSGKYRYSFYIPISANSIKSIYAAYHKLFVVYDHYLCWYDLHL